MSGGIFEDRTLLASRSAAPNTDDGRAQAFENVTVLSREVTNLGTRLKSAAREGRVVASFFQ